MRLMTRCVSAAALACCASMVGAEVLYSPPLQGPYYICQIVNTSTTTAVTIDAITIKSSGGYALDPDISSCTVDNDNVDFVLKPQESCFTTAQLAPYFNFGVFCSVTHSGEDGSILGSLSTMEAPSSADANGHSQAVSLQAVPSTERDELGFRAGSQ